MTRITRRFVAPVIVAALASAAPLFAAPPASASLPVMSLIPGDALGGVVMTNMQDFNGKIAKLVTQLGITRRYGIPLPPNLLAYGARVAGIDKALDFNASIAAFAWPTPAAAPQPRLPDDTFEHVIMLIPAIDPDALVAPFSPQPPDGDGIRQITTPLRPVPLFTAVINKKWVAAAAHIEDLQRYLKRTGASLDADPSAVAAFQRSDIVEWMNLPAMLAATGQDDAAITQAIDQDAANITGDTFSRAIQHQLIDDYAPTLLAATRDARDFFMTLRLADDGIAVGFSASTAKDSPTAKLLAAVLNAPPATLDGLPDGRLVIASTLTANGPAMARTLSPIFSHILENPDVSGDPRAAQLRGAFDTVTAMLNSFHSVKYALYHATPDADTGIFSGVALAEIDQPQKAVDALVKLASANIPGTPEISPNGLKTTPTFTPDALTIDGVHLARLQVSFGFDNDSPEAQQSMKVAHQMLGSDGLSVYLGAVDNQLLATICTNPDQLKAAVAAARTHAPALANRPEIKAAAALLPPRPTAVSYISPGEYISTLSEIYSLAGNPWGIDIQPLISPASRMAPATVSIGYDADTVGYHITFPVSDAVGILDIVDNVRHAIAHDAAAPIP